MDSLEAFDAELDEADSSEPFDAELDEEDACCLFNGVPSAVLRAICSFGTTNFARYSVIVTI